MSTKKEAQWNQTEYPLRRETLRAGRAALRREDGLRRGRRLTNWSLAALLVGVGATSASLAHVIPGHASPPGYVSTPAGGGAVAATPNGAAPALSAPVASSSPSQVVAGGGATSSGQSLRAPGAVSSTAAGTA